MKSKYAVQLPVPFIRPQRGAVLLVGLVMMLLITIIGLSAVRGTGLQEAMAGNMRDRNLAFQAAESALRIGESRIDTQVNESAMPPFDCSNGLCPDQEQNNPGGSVRYWTEAVQWQDRAVAVPDAVALLHVEARPRVIVEKLDPDQQACAASDGSALGYGSTGGGGASPFNCVYYRITALGYGADRNTQGIVQSIYRRFQ